MKGYSGRCNLNIPSSIGIAKLFGTLLLVIALVVGFAPVIVGSDESVRTGLGHPFPIILKASTGSTGYSWNAHFDAAFLKLEKSWYEKPQSALLGAPGQQVFLFVPLQAGETELEMRLERPWESKAAEVRVFKISIAAK